LVKKGKKYRLLFLIISVWSVLLSGCYKFEGDQTIPSYLKIDSVFIETFYAHQGTASSEITDVWVYIDDQQIGVFELPALFPVLAQGKHKLEIRPGIKLNGISSTRVPYPFYKPIRYENFDFYPDSVHDFGALKTTYYDNLTFAWMEDFEAPSLSIKETGDSDTTIERTEPADNAEAWLSEYSRYSGIVTLTGEHAYFEAMSFNAYELPKEEAPVLLELNFKTDNYVTVGLFINEPDRYIKSPLVTLNYSSEWNKIYINLGPLVSGYPKATDYKVYFAAQKRNDKTKTNIYLDNIKLIYRSNSK
jgi:hypothetical protein